MSQITKMFSPHTPGEEFVLWSKWTGYDRHVGEISRTWARRAATPGETLEILRELQSGMDTRGEAWGVRSGMRAEMSLPGEFYFLPVPEVKRDFGGVEHELFQAWAERVPIRQWLEKEIPQITREKAPIISASREFTRFDTVPRITNPEHLQRFLEGELAARKICLASHSLRGLRPYEDALPPPPMAPRVTASLLGYRVQWFSTLTGREFFL